MIAEAKWSQSLGLFWEAPDLVSAVKEWQPARLRKKNDFSLFGKSCNQRVLKIKTFTKVVLCYILTRLVASGPIYLGRA